MMNTLDDGETTIVALTVAALNPLTDGTLTERLMVNFGTAIDALGTVGTLVDQLRVSARGTAMLLSGIARSARW